MTDIDDPRASPMLMEAHLPWIPQDKCNQMFAMGIEKDCSILKIIIYISDSDLGKPHFFTQYSH